MAVFSVFTLAGFAQGTANGNQSAPPVYAQPGAAQPESVRPGSLNYVQGQVSSNGEALTPQSVGHFALNPGQTLQTGNGFAEILLTPGAFLRVGPNTEFRMDSVGLADTRINLSTGEAMIEVEQLISGAHLEVTVGTASVDLLKKGLYGLSANPAGVRVFKGQVEVVTQERTRKIGDHSQILFANNPALQKTGFNENEAKHEQLYVWSETRSREEASQNQLVARDSSRYVPVGGGWFWDPFINDYGFWPPGYFSSPFGFGFYGGFYPGFYGGYYGGFHRGFVDGWHHPGALRRGGFSGFHGNGVPGGFHGGGGFHAGGFHGGGFHGGGGRR